MCLDIHMANYFKSYCAPDNKENAITQSAEGFQILAKFKIEQYLAESRLNIEARLQVTANEASSFGITAVPDIASIGCF